MAGIPAKHRRGTQAAGGRRSAAGSQRGCHLFLATKDHLGQQKRPKQGASLGPWGEWGRGAGVTRGEAGGRLTARCAFGGNPRANLADGAGAIYRGVGCHPLRVGGRGKGVAVGDGCQAGKGGCPSRPFFCGSMPQKTGSEPALWRASVAAGWLCSPCI